MYMYQHPIIVFTAIRQYSNGIQQVASGRAMFQYKDRFLKFWDPHYKNETVLFLW